MSEDVLVIDGHAFRAEYAWTVPHRRWVGVYHKDKLIGETRSIDGVENPRQAARYYAKKWLREEASQ